MSDAPTFHEQGSVADEIDVEISFQIIGLFSEGLYSNPAKAVEELVSNSFDADATQVEVVISRDRGAADATVAVFDNGHGMDADGLKVHWIVGDSIKRRHRTTSSGRKTIGKFGIGKLAAYVLGERLTHISKSGGKYYSTSMDFRRIPATTGFDTKGRPKTATDNRRVKLDLRELSANEARAALAPWLSDDGEINGMKFFGRGAAKSWTAAIVSDLKDLASSLTTPMLKWILSTAMPLRDDFSLGLNSQAVKPSKMKSKRVGRWTLGKDIKTLPKPAPQADLHVEKKSDAADDGPEWMLIDPIIGPVHGYVEAFDAPINTGKSDLVIGRSNGFFVYVHGRLVNVDDAGFGIDRNKLRHGTFSRFRAVVHIDRLDDELRSSRETLRSGPRVERARDLLQGIFNHARSKIEQSDGEGTPERQVAQRLADSPASLTERPILRMVLDTFDGNFSARHLDTAGTGDFEDSDQLRAHIEERVESGAGLVADVLSADLGIYEPIASLNAVNGKLSINQEHPYVAYFADQFGDAKRNLPLQLFATAEILLEAQLHEAGIEATAIEDVLDSRDELLRHLARTSGVRNSHTVAAELVAAAQSPDGLEAAVVQAFNQMGFAAVPRGGSGDADGLAEAHLPVTEDGPGHYRVSLEAKSKQKVGGKVDNNALGVSRVARHRDKNSCAHAVVVGPDFVTGTDDEAAMMEEIENDYAETDRTITLVRAEDLARLVRIVPIKRINLADLRELFAEARSPSDSAAWIDALASRAVDAAPYQKILDTVLELQTEDPDHRVEYSGLRQALKGVGLTISKPDLQSQCQALSSMAENLFIAHDDYVELATSAEQVMEVIQQYVDDLPPEDNP